jgi:Alpha-L-rhamnosidase N-terminal domain./Bacterial alpha-L-rhamnosidase.
MKKKLFLSLFFITVLIQIVLASSPFEHASWISIKKDLQKGNQWICFRKEINIKEKNSSIPMHIAVDSKYWLWVNGKLVVFEGELKRGPNPNDTYYDTIELSSYLHKGNNTIAVLVWYWGKNGFCHKSSGNSGLIASISPNKRLIVTDATWKVKIHPAFGETGNPKPNFRLPESNVHYDARYGMEGWNQRSYSDKNWENASVMGLYPCTPWNKLLPRPFPNWKDSGIINYVQVDKKEKNDTLFIIGKLPRNITVTPYFKINAKAGQLIDIRSDNYRGGSEYNIRTEYITKDGIQNFEMPNYINGHHIIYTFPKNVKVISVGYRETAFNTQHIGSFRCNDDFYNKLWNKALNTMNLNMRDAIQDPDRERSQWWGDAAIISGEILYSCDNNGVKAIKKTINNLVDWQKPDGTLFSPIPSGSWDKELPQQMLASIGKYGFWNYYYYTGDIETLRHVYPAVKTYLSLWQLDENDLVKHRSGGWDWADWGDNIDVAILDNAWFCLALESASNMAHIVKDKNYASFCDSIRKRIITAVQKNFWTGKFYRSPQYKGITDDRANGMAILAGFSTPEQEINIREFLKDRYSASPYMEKYILESYFVCNDINGGLARMKQRYQNMVNSNLTTLWEDWRIGGSGGGSINHGWAGGPLTLLSQYVAGISPLGIGWNQILIHPQLGNLKWVECAVPIKDKTIKIRADKKNNELIIYLNNKTDRTCVVAIPQNAKSLKVNGKDISFASLKLIQKNNVDTNGLLSLELKEKYAVIRIICNK